MFRLPLFALVFLAACHRTSTLGLYAGSESVEELRPQVAKLSAEAQALVREQDELIWKSWTTGAQVDIAKSYAGHDRLFTPTNIAILRKVRGATRDEAAARGLAHLQTHFVGEYLAQQLTEVGNAIANVQAAATIEVGGKELPFRDLDRLLLNEKDAEKRRALYAGATKSVERISISLRRKEQRVTELLRSIGYPTKLAFSSELREARPEPLEGLARHVLELTDAPYERVVAELAQRELSLPRAELSRADLPRLFRPKGVETFFPKEALVEKVKATVAGLGIELDSIKGLKLEIGSEARRNPRALTLAVVVPSDVRLSAKPLGGVDDYGSTLHELAHALHYGHSDELPFEVAKLGNPTVTEAYGFLFESLLQDPLWLKQHTKLPPDRLASYLASAKAFALHRLRESAGAILTELEGAELDDAETKALYARVTARVYGIKPGPDDEARYLIDREDLLAPADTLRSVLLAGQLQAQLKAKFGATWWTAPAAGEWLKSLWKNANAKTADEIAQIIGEPEIRSEPLISRLTGPN